jgi:hypothetical protein
MDEAKAVDDPRSCPECRKLLRESCKANGVSINEVRLVSKKWPNGRCPHGRISTKYEVEIPVDNRREGCFHRHTEYGLECEGSNPIMDATKDIGYPVREYGPYGSHAIHDSFDDESGPDGPGTY